MRSLLLAGGRSSRMGQDKALIEIDGLPMIARVVNALVEAGKEPIRISVASPEKMEAYAAVIDSSYNIEWVLDSVQYAGPVDSIIENLNDPFAIKEDHVQLATIDVPWINADVFTSLEKSMSKNDMAVIPTDGQILHPLIALVRPKILKLQFKKWNDESLREVFLKNPHTLLMIDRALIKNINSRKDL